MIMKDNYAYDKTLINSYLTNRLILATYQLKLFSLNLTNFLLILDRNRKELLLMPEYIMVI